MGFFGSRRGWAEPVWNPVRHKSRCVQTPKNIFYTTVNAGVHSCSHYHHLHIAGNMAGFKRPRAGSASATKRHLKQRIAKQKPTAENQKNQIAALERTVQRLSGRVADTFTSFPHVFTADQYLTGTSYVYHFNDPITLTALWQTAPGGIMATESARLKMINVKGQIDGPNHPFNETFQIFFVKLKDESKARWPNGYIDGPLVINRDFTKQRLPFLHQFGHLPYLRPAQVSCGHHGNWRTR